MCTVDEQLNNNKSQSTAESQDSGTIVQYCQCNISQAVLIRVCNISTSHPLDTMCTVDEQLNNNKSQSTAESQDSDTIVWEEGAATVFKIRIRVYSVILQTKTIAPKRQIMQSSKVTQTDGIKAVKLTKRDLNPV
ncbi:hypothetical protein J6590_097134 [Homalodisca vitripennis]|nr:hypothetical protein J6590_097134 [Homalodisca vitripennis]